MSKKISEIIIELNDKTDKILQNLVNQDLLLKTIVKRLNSISLLLNNDKISNNISNEISQLTEEIKSIPSILTTSTHTYVDEKSNEIEVKETIQTDPNLIRVPGMKEGIFLHKDTGIVHKKTIRGHQYAVPVQQKLLYSDGTPITMANVELLSEETGSLVSVKKLKTNATGKWTTNIQPGSYVVKVFKNKNHNREEVRHLADIVVPEDKSGTQLQDLII